MHILYIHPHLYIYIYIHTCTVLQQIYIYIYTMIYMHSNVCNKASSLSYIIYLYKDCRTDIVV